MNKNIPLLSLILPSKGRFLDLLLTLIFTSLKSHYNYKVKFIIVANYNNFQIIILKLFFSHRAFIIDERGTAIRGLTSAYNYGFDFAKNNNTKWIALWADDLLPHNSNWLDELFLFITESDFQFGIFSSDEGYHKGRYGYNIVAGYPCAHFYVACIDSLPGYMLNPSFQNYLADNEIAISRIKQNISISLLPIKLHHQATINSTRVTSVRSLKKDLACLSIIHPELSNKLDSIILNGDVNNSNFKFILDSDTNKVIKFQSDMKTLSYPDFMSQSKILIIPLKIRLIYLLRKIWNRLILKIELLLKK
jgi:hypothetical protein